MRHPVSTSPHSGGSGIGLLVLEEGECPSVVVDVVGGVVEPAAPEDTEPSASEDADGVGMSAPALSGGTIDGGRPGMGEPGVAGPGGEGATQTLVASEAAGDATVLARGVGNGSDAGFGSELVFGGEAEAIVAEFGEDLGGIDGAGAWEGLKDVAVGVLGDESGDEAVSLADLGHEGLEDGEEASDELALGLALELAGESSRRGAETLEELGRRAAPRVVVRLEEALEALLSEASGALRGRVAVEEREGDGTVHVSENHGGTGPEAFQEATELVGELDASGDEIVAGADGSAQSLGLIRGYTQGWEAVTIGAQDIGEDVGIAGIALAERGRVARPSRFERVGVDRHDTEAGLDERVNEQARGALDRDGELARLTKAREAPDQVGEPLRGVFGNTAVLDSPLLVEETDVVLVTRPIDADVVQWRSFHAVPPQAAGFLRSGVGRTCRGLTERRSGLQVPWRNTLSSVGAFRAGRRSGSHTGRLAASKRGSLHPDAEAYMRAVNLPLTPRKVDQ